MSKLDYDINELGDDVEYEELNENSFNEDE